MNTFAATAPDSVEWLTDDVEGVGTRVPGRATPATTRPERPACRTLQTAASLTHTYRFTAYAGYTSRSTSVLPTSSQANPTLVGIALGVRLAERLRKSRMGCGRAEFTTA